MNNALIDRHRFYIDQHTFRRSSQEAQENYLRNHSLQLIDAGSDLLIHNPTLPDKMNDDEWKAPAWAFRGSLFQVIPRKILRETFFYPQATTVVNHDSRQSIQAVGPILSLSDRKIWLEMLSKLQCTPASQELKVKNKPVLKAIGSSYGSDTVAMLKKTLIRLAQADISYVRVDHTGQKQVQYITPLLYYNEETHTVSIPPVLMLLMQQEHRNYETLRGVQKKQQLHHVSINKEQHNRLSMEVSMWVHGWFSSHDKWIPLPLKTLEERAGIQIALKKNQNKMCTQLLTDLQQLHDFATFKIEVEALVAQKCDD